MKMSGISGNLLHNTSKSKNNESNISSIYCQDEVDELGNTKIYRPVVTVSWNCENKTPKTYTPLQSYKSMSDCMDYFKKWDNAYQKNLVMISSKRVDVYDYKGLVGSHEI